MAGTHNGQALVCGPTGRYSGGSSARPLPARRALFGEYANGKQRAWKVRTGLNAPAGSSPVFSAPGRYANWKAGSLENCRPSRG